jgi:hypothetical protein
VQNLFATGFTSIVPHARTLGEKNQHTDINQNKIAERSTWSAKTTFHFITLLLN